MMSGWSRHLFLDCELLEAGTVFLVSPFPCSHLQAQELVHRESLNKQFYTRINLTILKKKTLNGIKVNNDSDVRIELPNMSCLLVVYVGHAASVY